MAHNLIKSFQMATTAGRRPATRKRRARYTLEAIQTLRYKCINRAGVLVHPDGYPTLDIGNGTEVKNRFIEIDARLRKVA
jgi:hypothetical protein